MFRIVLKYLNLDVMLKIFYTVINDAYNVIIVKYNGGGRGGALFELGKGRKLCGESRKSDWLLIMFFILVVLGNRKFVFDVIGRVIFEIMRLFFEFLFEKVFVSVKRSVCVVNEVFVDRGF